MEGEVLLIVTSHCLYRLRADNPLETYQLAAKFSVLAIANATVSVDTFFVMRYDDDNADADYDSDDDDDDDDDDDNNDDSE